MPWYVQKLELLMKNFAMIGAAGYSTSSYEGFKDTGNKLVAPDEMIQLGYR